MIKNYGDCLSKKKFCHVSCDISLLGNIFKCSREYSKLMELKQITILFKLTKGNSKILIVVFNKNSYTLGCSFVPVFHTLNESI